MQFLVLFESKGGLHDVSVFFGLMRGILFEPCLVLKERREHVREKRQIVGCDLFPLIEGFTRALRSFPQRTETSAPESVCRRCTSARRAFLRQEDRLIPCPWLRVSVSGNFA